MKEIGGKSMSRGFGGFANKVFEDDTTIIYAYGGFNLNIPEYRNENDVRDGSLIISKSCFINQKDLNSCFTSTPNNKVTENLPQGIDIAGALEEGLIQVKNCSHTWQVIGEKEQYDRIALHLLFKLFREYPKTGSIPEKIIYVC